MQFLDGDEAAAEEEVRKAIKMNEKDEGARLMLWYLQCKQNKTAEADAEISAFAKEAGQRPQADTWQGKVRDFLAGRMKETELLTIAEKERIEATRLLRCCEAHFFAGMQCLNTGRKPEAAEHFLKAVETQKLSAATCGLAERELKALEP
jgi:lipoprotein NlpI